MFGTEAEWKQVRTIEALEHEIQGIQARLAVTRSAWRESMRVESEQRRLLAHIDRRIGATDLPIVRTWRGRWASGARVQHGTFVLGREDLAFSGWRSKALVVLEDVVHAGICRRPLSINPVVSVLGYRRSRTQEIVDLIELDFNPGPQRCTSAAIIPDSGDASGCYADLRALLSLEHRQRPEHRDLHAARAECLDALRTAQKLASERRTALVALEAELDRLRGKQADLIEEPYGFRP